MRNDSTKRGPPARRATPSSRSLAPARACRMSLGAALALLGALLFIPAAASAHHILGIPHYAYSEEYPQIPFMEIQAQAGPYDLHLSTYPGTPRPGERVRVKLYIRNRESGEPFRERLHAQVFRKRFLRGAAPVGVPFEVHVGSGPERNDYKFYLTFDEPESYELRLSFPVAGGVEVIPFPISIGKTDSRPLLYGAVALILLAMVLVRVLKGRRDRRRKRGARGARGSGAASEP